MTPKVYNRRTTRRLRDDAANPKTDVYIGRPSKWGNPYEIGKDGDRDHVLMRYREHLKRHPELVQAAKDELKGKNLVCWCKPLACHGDILLEIANG